MANQANEIAHTELDFTQVACKRRYQCPVHGVTSAVFYVIYANERYETIFNHSYCLTCYDAFLQRHLPILKEVAPE
jgi:hypothetical protein